MPSTSLAVTLLDRNRSPSAITGKTVLEAIQNEQLSRVRHLLRTTALSITEISYRYNFRSENHLKRLFKKSFGMTMRDYRRQNQA